MPEFSFVIPVYNGADHLAECLDSILGQTFRDLEVICVDDCSADASRALLRSYAAKDARVRVIEHEENRGSARARRRGVLATNGRYVLFSDQDDAYDLRACEVLHAQLCSHAVDVLQYGTHVVNEGGVEQGEIDGLGVWMAPYEGELHGRDILDECFVNLTFGYSVWNKVYEGDLARRAFAATRDAPVPLGEDNYESFALFYFAETYRGIPDVLYHYHYGRGYTGQQQQSAQSFKRICGLSVAADLIRSFLDDQGVSERYRDTCEAARRHMLRYTFDRWEKEVPAAQQLEALRFLLDAWPYDQVLNVVAQERPRDLPALLDARFGPVGDAADELACLRRELAGLTDACRQKDKRVRAHRQAYEKSRAYRVGRAITFPLRLVRKNR